MSVLNRIRDTLQTLCASEETPMEGVWYGGCRADKLDTWNYFVFNRQKGIKASNRMDLETRYEIHIIHEDYIPEGYVQTVIDALEAPAGPGTKLRLADEDILYEYTFKGNTTMVVEVATLVFIHPEKRC